MSLGFHTLLQTSWHTSKGSWCICVCAQHGSEEWSQGRREEPRARWSFSFWKQGLQRLRKLKVAWEWSHNGGKQRQERKIAKPPTNSQGNHSSSLIQPYLKLHDFTVTWPIIPTPSWLVWIEFLLHEILKNTVYRWKKLTACWPPTCSLQTNWNQKIDNWDSWKITLLLHHQPIRRIFTSWLHTLQPHP